MPAQYLQAVEEEFGGQPDEGQQDGEANVEKHDGAELEAMAEKYEQLKTQVEQHFDDDHGRARKKVPVVRPVLRRTQLW